MTARPIISPEYKARQANIREVAQLAGVSVATVSRTLTSPKLVAPKTLERVNAAIEQLKYTPNAQVQALITSKSKLVIALVPDIANPFFAEVIRGIERVAHQNGYSILLGDTQYERAREQSYAKLVPSRQADGLITLLPNIPVMRMEGRMPVVNACEIVDDPEITRVCIDNVAAARVAVEYLVMLGHRQIGFLLGRANSPVAVAREEGYRQALAAAKIVFDQAKVVKGDFSAASGIRAVETLYARGLNCTAIFCSSDEMALGAIRAIRARGLQVPEDVSVVGFDDIRLSRYFDPPLTTIAQPALEMGQEAMTLLLEILSGSNPPPSKRVFPAHLVVRSSAMPPRRIDPA